MSKYLISNNYFNNVSYEPILVLLLYTDLHIVYF